MTPASDIELWGKTVPLALAIVFYAIFAATFVLG